MCIRDRYIGDAVGQKVFSTLTVDAKGVGTNINRAYINAFRAINGKNVKMQMCIRDSHADEEEN